jgi:hypothetical protein
MADCIGFAAGTLQLLSLGIKAVNTASSAKDASEDIQTLLQDLKYLQGVLPKIFCVGREEPECLQNPIDEFTRDLELLTNTLKALDLKKSKRICWVLWEKNRVKKATERIEAYKSLFNMALNADEKYVTCRRSEFMGTN